MKETRRCYKCRNPIKSKKNLYCKKCEQDPNRGKQTMGTLVFYHKV